MFTWLLLPLGLSLTLSFAGPVVTGSLSGGPDGPCPVTGSVDGVRVGLTAICPAPAHMVLPGLVLPPTVHPLALLLDVDPATLGGTWRDSEAHAGTLAPQ